MQCIHGGLLILSLLYIAKIKGGDIDLNVCDPLNLKPTPPPPPALTPSYSTKLEWKWVDKNETVSVTEVHDGINNIGSQTIYMLGHTVQIIYDYEESQYIVYDPDTGCNATGLGTIVYYDNKIWLTATKIIYHLAREGNAPHIGETVVRNVSVGHWKACLYFFQSNITLEIDMYFSVTGWGMAISAPNQMVPVRFEMKGSYGYQNDSNTTATYFHVIGDFVDFNPNPPSNLDPLQPPPGTFCQGRSSRKPMNPLPTSFSLVMENIDMDYFQITYQSIWFHAEKKLIRRDTKEARGSDPDPTIDILDYNLGIHYNMDSYTSSCSSSVITVQELYARAHGNDTCVMQSALDFFHVLNTDIQYVGTRTARGVACDVWVGVYLDTASNRNNTIEWYFTKDNWVEAVDLAIQPAALIRMDIWEGGSNNPIIHNIYHFNPVAPPLDVFNVAPCYQSSQKRRILIPFKALNGARIDKVSARYLKDLLHDIITSRTYIDPLRMTDLMIEFQGSSMVYLAATLLDRPSLTSPHLFPQPSPPSKLHDLGETYLFLTGMVNQPLTLQVNSTEGTKPVTIQATGLINIDYPTDASSTTSTTTRSTTEATPPPPTKAPTTTKQIIPTPGKEELKTTKSTTTTPTTTTTLTTTKMPSTLPNASSSPTMTTTQPPCTCPKVTCPPVKPTTTVKPTSCPTPPPQKSCATKLSTLSALPSTTPSTTTTTSATTTTSVPSTSSSTKPTSTISSTSTQTRSITPTVTPPALVMKTTTSSRKSSSTSSENATNNPLRQRKNTNPGSNGMSGGVVAAISIVTLVVGLICGIVALRLYQMYRKDRSPEGKNILSRYLDDDLKY